jgi:hypothetical protein
MEFCTPRRSLPCFCISSFRFCSWRREREGEERRKEIEEKRQGVSNKTEVKTYGKTS